MRALVDIPDNQIETLAELCDAQGISRAEAIRRAIAGYLEQQKGEAVEAFGLWASSRDAANTDPAESSAEKQDGLAYQEKMRSEW